MTASNENNTREQWLTEAAELSFEAMNDASAGSLLADYSIPSVKVSCSRPNTRTSQAARVIERESTGDFEIFIGAELSDEFRIVELILSCLTWSVLKKNRLQCRARNVRAVSAGLINRAHGGSNPSLWRYSRASSSDQRAFGTDDVAFKIVETLGAYPHASLTVEDVRSDVSHRGVTRSRQIKVTCADASCGMILRASSSRLIEIGLPVCGCGSSMHSAELGAIVEARSRAAAARSEAAREAVMNHRASSLATPGATVGSNAARTEQDAANLMGALTEITSEMAGGVAVNDKRQTRVRPTVDIDWDDAKLEGVREMQYFGAFQGSDLYVAKRNDDSSLFVCIIQTSGSVYVAEPSESLGAYQYAGATMVERDTWEAQVWHAWNDVNAWRGGVFSRTSRPVEESSESGTVEHELADGSVVEVKISKRFRALELDDTDPALQAEEMVRQAEAIRVSKRFEKLDFDD